VRITRFAVVAATTCRPLSHDVLPEQGDRPLMDEARGAALKMKVDSKPEERRFDGSGNHPGSRSSRAAPRRRKATPVEKEPACCRGKKELARLEKAIGRH